MKNTILDEDIVQARIVNTQTVDFTDWCMRMANGSTVTAADVAAVMQQIEDKLPEILSLNAKVVCSPGGLIFRPKVSGSITQSELKAKLQARKDAETDPEKAAKIDVDRAITTSDLSISDCTVSIEVALPKDWSDTFKKRATLKRVGKALTGTDSTDDSGGTPGGSDTDSGSDSGSETTNVTAPTINGTTPFEESTEVTITGPADAEIRYTTNGSDPTAESNLYNSAITLSDSATVKAIAIKDGVSSSVTTKVFTKASDGGDDY